MLACPRDSRAACTGDGWGAQVSGSPPAATRPAADSGVSSRFRPPAGPRSAPPSTGGQGRDRPREAAVSGNGCARGARLHPVRPRGPAAPMEAPCRERGRHAGRTYHPLSAASADGEKAQENPTLCSPREPTPQDLACPLGVTRTKDGAGCWSVMPTAPQAKGERGVSEARVWLPPADPAQRHTARASQGAKWFRVRVSPLELHLPSTETLEGLPGSVGVQKPTPGKEVAT